MSLDLDAARLFAAFEKFPGLLLAVSGGPDSLALMLLAAQWRDSGAKIPLFVATVDHGLRPDSAAEAKTVGRWARARGLEHAILTWGGEKPRTAIQERAREARYALLFAHAREVGAGAVATAHHADDQWETILFRLARGSGLAGLAGMAPDQAFPGGRLVRPLLGLPKQALVDFCRAQGQEFFEDPANSNPLFARARLRRLAEPLQELGFTRKKAQKLAARAHKANEAIDWAAAEIFRRAAISPEADAYDLGGIEDAPPLLFERFLEQALARAAGAPPRRLERLESLAFRLAEALREGKRFSATLAGCSVRLDAQKRLTLRPEGPRRRGGAPGRQRTVKQ